MVECTSIQKCPTCLLDIILKGRMREEFEGVSDIFDISRSVRLKVLQGVFWHGEKVYLEITKKKYENINFLLHLYSANFGGYN